MSSYSVQSADFNIIFLIPGIDFFVIFAYRWGTCKSAEECLLSVSRNIWTKNKTWVDTSWQDLVDSFYRGVSFRSLYVLVQTSIQWKLALPRECSHDCNFEPISYGAIRLVTTNLKQPNQQPQNGWIYYSSDKMHCFRHKKLLVRQILLILKTDQVDRGRPELISPMGP